MSYKVMIRSPDGNVKDAWEMHARESMTALLFRVLGVSCEDLEEAVVINHNFGIAISMWKTGGSSLVNKDFDTQLHAYKVFVGALEDKQEEVIIR